MMTADERAQLLQELLDQFRLLRGGPAPFLNTQRDHLLACQPFETANKGQTLGDQTNHPLQGSANAGQHCA
jgi:hypothetical protein